MSGILGIWNLDGQPVGQAVLAGMSATLAHRGPDGEGRWIEGPIGLACQLLRVTPEAGTETQPLVHASGAVLVFDGRLDNREELLARLNSPEIASDAPDPALVLAAYEVFGERFPERLTGDFALGLFDANRRQLLLAQDALGVRPLYYYRTRELFLFASEIKALLAHPQVSPRPNDAILAEAILSFPIEDHHGLTCFEGVSSLLPAHLAVLTPQGFVTRRYWDFDPTWRTRLGSFPEYVEAFRHHFEQAVRRRLRSAYPVAVSVSGGLDSSSVFCLAETLRRRAPDGYPPILGLSYTSTDGSPSDESAFVSAIERAYEIAITRIPINVGFLNGCREAVWHCENPVVDEGWHTTHGLLQTARQHGARVVLTGHWGDEMLFNQAYLADLYGCLAWGKIWAHLKELRRWRTHMDPKYFRRQLFRNFVLHHVPGVLVPFLLGFRARLLRPTQDRPWYTAAFRQQSRLPATQRPSIRERFPTAHARALYQEARSRSHVLFAEWNNKAAAMQGLEIAFPFLDRDLISFLIAIPGEMQTWKGVPKAILREAMRGVLPDAIVRRNWKASFDHLDREGMKRAYPHLADYLNSGAMVTRLGYVKEDMMREELLRLKEQIDQPNSDAGTRFADLLGLELWLRVFLGETRTRKEGSVICEGRSRTMVASETT